MKNVTETILKPKTMTSKKRILWCSEASHLSTGYAVYSREVLMRLHRSDKYEIAELACYCPDGHPYIQSRPWKIYPIVPQDGTEERQLYENYRSAQFGELRFEHICLDFKPDFVCGIKDYWMDIQMYNSPFRRLYNILHMPTVDAEPQAAQWVDVYCDADAVFTYQDWSGEVLKRQSGDKIKYRGSASPAASDFFMPKSLNERKLLKQQRLGLGPDVKVVGTVMRNQRRKLYPNLFEAFREYLDRSKRKDIVLYCHVSYPDGAWDIPELIKEYSLSSKVYLTYICNACGYVHSTTFQDAGCVCPRCHNFACSICSPHKGVNNQQLNEIYNIFDLYVQYSNSEGFGMPQVEAASAGVPVAATDYSAMHDIMKKLKGFAIRPLTKEVEIETGCKRAIPDNEHLIQYLTEFFSLPEPIREKKRAETRLACESAYNWDATAEKWMEAIDELEPRDWSSGPAIHYPIGYHEREELNNYDYASWLITDVLGEPNKLNSYFHLRIVRDLNYGVAIEGLPGMYYNDMANQFYKIPHSPFTREIAYKKVLEICQKRNMWEQERWRRFGVG